MIINKCMYGHASRKTHLKDKVHQIYKKTEFKFKSILKFNYAAPEIVCKSVNIKVNFFTFFEKYLFIYLFSMLEYKE